MIGFRRKPSAAGTHSDTHPLCSELSASASSLNSCLTHHSQQSGSVSGAGAIRSRNNNTLPRQSPVNSSLQSTRPSQLQPRRNSLTSGRTLPAPASLIPTPIDSPTTTSSATATNTTIAEPDPTLGGVGDGDSSGQQTDTPCVDQPRRLSNGRQRETNGSASARPLPRPIPTPSRTPPLQSLDSCESHPSPTLSTGMPAESASARRLSKMRGTTPSPKTKSPRTPVEPKVPDP